jgi:hypothetical protein
VISADAAGASAARAVSAPKASGITRQWWTGRRRRSRRPRRRSIAAGGGTGGGRRRAGRRDARGRAAEPGAEGHAGWRVGRARALTVAIKGQGRDQGARVRADAVHMSRLVRAHDLPPTSRRAWAARFARAVGVPMLLAGKSPRVQTAAAAPRRGGFSPPRRAIPGTPWVGPKAVATALLAMTAGLSVTSTRAFAAPDSGLRHACHYRYGVGDYQDVSYSGATPAMRQGLSSRSSPTMGSEGPNRECGRRTRRTVSGGARPSGAARPTA